MPSNLLVKKFGSFSSDGVAGTTPRTAEAEKPTDTAEVCQVQ